MASANLLMRRPLSEASMRRHSDPSSNALRAAATALSTSAWNQHYVLSVKFWRAPQYKDINETIQRANRTHYIEYIQEYPPSQMKIVRESKSESFRIPLPPKKYILLLRDSSVIQRKCGANYNSISIERRGRKCSDILSGESSEAPPLRTTTF